MIRCPHTKKASTALEPTAAASALSHVNWIGMDPSQMALATGLCGAGVVAVVEVDAAAGVFPCPGCGGMNRDRDSSVGCGCDVCAWREVCELRGVGEQGKSRCDEGRRCEKKEKEEEGRARKEGMEWMSA